MVGFFVIMLAGFAGSFHCIGMCGGFACALGPRGDASLLWTAVRHLLYNLGRLVTYTFIGALTGLLGTALVGHGFGHGGGLVLAGELGLGQRLLSVLGGALMVVMALQLFGLMRHLPASWAGRPDGFFVSALRAVLASRSPAAPVALGVLNGFLPCPLVYAFAALAAATGTVLGGILTMAALGIGTFPAMLFMGFLGHVLAPATRRGGVRLAGGFVLVLSMVTLVRGIAPSLLHFSGHGM